METGIWGGSHGGGQLLVLRVFWVCTAISKTVISTRWTLIKLHSSQVYGHDWWQSSTSQSSDFSVVICKEPDQAQCVMKQEALFWSLSSSFSFLFPWSTGAGPDGWHGVGAGAQVQGTGIMIGFSPDSLCSRTEKTLPLCFWILSGREKQKAIRGRQSNMVTPPSSPGTLFWGLLLAGGWTLFRVY